MASPSGTLCGTTSWVLEPPMSTAPTRREPGTDLPGEIQTERSTKGIGLKKCDLNCTRVPEISIDIPRHVVGGQDRIVRLGIPRNCAEITPL